MSILGYWKQGFSFLGKKNYAHICFKSVRKNFQVQLMKLRLKKDVFFNKKRARALLLRSVQNQKMHVIYIILSLHAKNQPPRTMLSYVYTLFKFPGE